MYTIQSGKVEITQLRNGMDIFLSELGEGDFFGAMALFTNELRSATVRAKGKVAVLTVDKKTLLSRIQKDPSLAFRIIQQLSSRVNEMNAQYSKIMASDRRNWDTRSDKVDGESIEKK